MPDLDQIFVNLKHWLLGQLTPVFAGRLVVLRLYLLSLIPILAVFPALFAIMTIMERKGLGRIQNRYGPNRVGPFGFLQPAADGIKALIKEDLVPRAADKVVHLLAPVILVVTAFTVYACCRSGATWSCSISTRACCSSLPLAQRRNSRCSWPAGRVATNTRLLGAMRAVAQMVSYEIPLILATVSVVMITGTLSLAENRRRPGHSLRFLAGLVRIFTPWGFAGFLLFMIAANAEANRSPFDLPEGESEIIAGYFIEYSGFKFALFFLAEYLSLFAISGLGITLFLGGWNAPFAALEFIPSWAWFFIKLITLMCLFIWTRGTLPRLRQDQLMNFAWKFMIPMVLINLVAAALWHFISGALVRWLVCGAIVVGAYLLLGRGLAQGKQITKRTYRFAE
jgi:NADH-quinone oxidoreductase subunit H